MSPPSPETAPAAAKGPLPYGRQEISKADITAVVDVLTSDWLTTGPTVVRFEQKLAQQVGAREGVAVCNGTAALHAAMDAARVRPADEVVVPAMTFAATANAVLYQGGRPVFVDVDPDTLLIDPEAVARSLTSRTKAIVAVDYAGQPCDYEALRSIASDHGVPLIADACHSLGGSDRGRKVGTLADLTAFSFHPVKPITTGEGGMVVTDDAVMATRMRAFRNHGITSDHRQRTENGTFRYAMELLGYNYRLTDLQSALGISQLDRLDAWTERRRAIAERYREAFAQVKGIKMLTERPDVQHAYHLVVIQVDVEEYGVDRDALHATLRQAGISANVHYLPVHLHPYYREQLGTGPGLCPVAEAAYERILSLPVYPAMTDADVDRVVLHIRKGMRGA